MTLKKMEITHVSAVSREVGRSDVEYFKTAEEFSKSRTARLEISGKLPVTVKGKEEVREVKLVFTRGNCSQGEFHGLCKLIGQKGILEGEFSNYRTREIIRGKVQPLRNGAKVDIKLTNEDGTFAPVFHAAPENSWAKEFGTVGTEYLAVPLSEESRLKGRETIAKIREEAPDATAGDDTDVSI